VLGLHLVQHLSSPHLEAPPLTLSRLLGQRNLEKLFLLQRTMLVSVETIQFQGLCPHVHGSSKDLEILMEVMVPVRIIHMVDSVELIVPVPVGYMEITCIQVMEEVMVVLTVVLECMVGRCIITGWEILTVVWAWVLTIRVLIRLALQHHPQVSGCPSYE